MPKFDKKSLLGVDFRNKIGLHFYLRPCIINSGYFRCGTKNGISDRSSSHIHCGRAFLKRLCICPVCGWQVFFSWISLCRRGNSAGSTPNTRFLCESQDTGGNYIG